MLETTRLILHAHTVSQRKTRYEGSALKMKWCLSVYARLSMMNIADSHNRNTSLLRDNMCHNYSPRFSFTQLSPETLLVTLYSVLRKLFLAVSITT
jgi:hypothetical protein